MTTAVTASNINNLARWWTPLANGRLRCDLCPRECTLSRGQRGFCYLRHNADGRLVTDAHGTAVGLAVDPIEKKPLYHFYPGNQILSFGTVGCNLGCKFCQNWHISSDYSGSGRRYSADEIVELARQYDCLGIAYTYNDPIIFGEWMIEVAQKARAAGLKNVLVTNGYVSDRARSEIFSAADAVNMDLKSIDDRFYHRLTGGKLAPVLDSLRWLAESNVWLEITTLVIPGENDEPAQLRQLSEFIVNELGSEIPLHFSAFHPAFRMNQHPATPLTTLEKAAAIARSAGVRHVYLGNVMSSSGSTTCCPQCGGELIRRQGYRTRISGLENNTCRHCGTTIAGHFEELK